jgi:hypothetical protein
MFRAANRSSSDLNCICSLWFIHACGDRPLSHSALTTAGHHMRDGWSVVGRGRPDHDQQRSNRHAPTVKPEAPSEVVCSWWCAERCSKHVEPSVNFGIINSIRGCILMFLLSHITMHGSMNIKFIFRLILISNFRRVLNVVFFLMDDSSASKFYMPTFWDTLSHLHKRCNQKEYLRYRLFFLQTPRLKMEQAVFRNVGI